MSEQRTTERLADAMAEADGGWRDIETAPKDGRQFDVWIDWRGRVPNVLYDRGVFRECAIDEFDGLSWQRLDGDPSHWMPLPAPPASEDRSA